MRFLKPSLIHDPSYGGEIFARWLNDLLLEGAMTRSQAGRVVRGCFYVSVRSWGWLTYLGHTRKSISRNRSLLEIRLE